MVNFSHWLKGAWQDFLSWFGVEEQKIASLLYPIFQDAKKLAEHDLLKDIIDGVPLVALALAGGDSVALAAAEKFILSSVTKQGIELEHTTVGALSNALVAQAKTAQAAITPTPPPAAA